MRTILIVYHSQSGSCAKLALAAMRGARVEASVKVVLRRACDASTLDLAGADALLLVAAENSAALSGGVKDFLDRCFYPCIKRGLVLPYALLISAGNDGRNAAAQAQRILLGIPFTQATEPLILRGEVSEQALLSAQELGTGFAAGLVMGIF